MKIIRFFAAFSVLALAVFGAKSSPSGLQAFCGSDSTPSASCSQGPVTFEGTGYPKRVLVEIDDTEGVYYGPALQQAPGGVLSIPQDVSLDMGQTSDTFTIIVSTGNGNTILSQDSVMITQ